jgi:hypothetical protein
MKELSLTPYPGTVFVFNKLKELRKKYKQLCGVKYPYHDNELTSGRYIYIEGNEGQVWFLVYGNRASTLAHEFVHCLLKLFEIVDIDPRDSKGEPLCYMLSRLMRQTLDEEAMNE